MKLKNVLAATAALAGVLFLVGSANAHGHKTTLCHYSVDDDCWVTITVATSSVEAHLAHGDSLDVETCPNTCAARE